MSSAMIAPRMMALATSIAATLLLPGCDEHQLAQVDPYKREGMWRPEGINAGNIAAQLADPRDLVRGRGDSTPQIKQATRAVNRIWGPTPGGGTPPAAGGAGGGSAGGGSAGGGGAALLRGPGSGGGTDSP